MCTRAGVGADGRPGTPGKLKLMPHNDAREDGDDRLHLYISAPKSPRTRRSQSQPVETGNWDILADFLAGTTFAAIAILSGANEPLPTPSNRDGLED